MITGRKCFKCEKELDGDLFMLGLDRPHVNLWFHRDCFEGIDDLLKYLISKTDEIRQEMPIYV